MGLRMHRYDDGLTGLAAFCDVCGEQITNDDGYVVWKDDGRADDQPIEWLVIHQGRCDPGREYANSMGLAEEIVYLTHSTGADYESAKKRVEFFSGWD